MFNEPPISGGEYYVFRDAVHNLIEVDDAGEGRALRAVLRTREMQRLRAIRQNGLAALVYVSMENSRFAHSLGTFHVARRVVQSLRQREPQQAHGFPTSLTIDARSAFAFCIAALVHDIGHAPFSHAWEDFMHAEYGYPGTESLHEAVTLAILRGNTEIGRLLGAPLGVENTRLLDGILDEVDAFLSGRHRLSYLHGLISGHLDVDRLDFMARDTRSAGVVYGFHDLEWLVRALHVVKMPHHSSGKGGWVLALDSRKGLHTLEQFLLARASMYRQVYHHKTARAAGAMLRLLLARAAELHAPAATPALTRFLENPQGFPPVDYSLLDDSDVVASVKLWSDYSNDSVLRSLAAQMLRRELFKVIPIDKKVYQELKSMQAHLDTIIVTRMSCPPDQARFYYTLDQTHFDYIGTRTEDEDTIWIFGPGIPGTPDFRTLREWWHTLHNVTDYDQYLIIVHPKAIGDIARVVARLRAGPPTHSLRAELEVPTPPDGYNILSHLGSGFHKDAYLAVGPSGLVALKCYHEDAKSVAALWRDSTVPSTLVGPHANLALPRRVSMDGPLWLEERLWERTLNEVISKSAPFRDTAVFLDISQQLFTALNAIHQRSLRHTDIKPDNCGVVEDTPGGPVYQIGDFGCVSSECDEVPVSAELRGSLRTRSPEMLSSPPAISLRSDVWALAATLVALLLRRFPYMGFDDDIGRPGSEARITFESALVASLGERQETFRTQIRTDLPPVIANWLVPCFDDAAHRPDAPLVLAGIKAAQRLHSERNPSAAGVWSRAETLADTIRTLADRPLSDMVRSEAEELTSRFEDEIPPRIRDVLNITSSTA